MSYLYPAAVLAHQQHRRSSTITRSAALLLVVLLSFLLLPATARGADSVDLTLDADVIPDRATLSTGDVTTYVAYRLSFTNGNKSTLTQTRLRLRKPSITGSSATATLVDIYPGNLARSCETSGGNLVADCDFGRVRPDRTIALTFLFRLPPYGAIDLPADLVFAKQDAILTIKEGTFDAGANQDTWYAQTNQIVQLASVPEDSGGTQQKYFGTYTPAEGGTWGTNGTDIQRDTAQLSAANDQATKVIVPPTNQGTVTILKEISPAGTFTCPEADACFGDVSELTVPDLGSKPIIVFVRWNDSALPNGMTPKKLRVAWDPDDDGPLPAKVVGKTCNQNASNTPCRYATERFGDKDLGVLLVLPHNGRIRGM